jgi:hypothetical protein
MIDPDSVETAFHRIFAWVQAGTVADASRDGRPYRWKRDGWEATHMPKSPSGEFQHLSGPNVVVFYRPTRPGISKEVALRASTTRERLVAAAAAIDVRDPVADQAVAKREPSHIQINPLAGGKWGWCVWFGGERTEFDRDGTAPSLVAAMESVMAAIENPHEA